MNIVILVCLFFSFLVLKFLMTLTKFLQDVIEFGIKVCLDTRLFLHSAYSHPIQFYHHLAMPCSLISLEMVTRLLTD